MNLARRVAETLARLLDRPVSDIEELLETPPDLALGDISLPCFFLAKTRRQAPAAIAAELAEQVNEPWIARSEAAGPYLNIFLNRSEEAAALLQADITSAELEGHVVIEYPSPNTNKPLHLGHLRNMFLGAALVHILEAAGKDVTAVNLNNDRGVHICKSMLAYQRWGNESTPEGMGMRADKFVGHWYVEFARRADEDDNLQQAAQRMLQAWEEGDPEVRALWKKMNAWAYEGHAATYARLGINHEKTYYESDHYLHGKEIVQGGVDSGALFIAEDGSIRADLDKLGEKVVLRADGTSVYMTQDIALAFAKQADFAPDEQIIIVGDEQRMHFLQLTEILQRLGMEHAAGVRAFCYGMIRLPEGKMKSREGTVVDADDLLDELETLAREEIVTRYENLEEDEVDLRARVLANAAIRYFMHKYEPTTGFVYDPKESLSFEGETGPYILYAIARIKSLLREQKPPSGVAAEGLTSDEEWALLRLLGQSVHVVVEAARTRKPHLVARHAMDIARAYTAFYHAHRILGSDQQDARLALSARTAEHLERLLSMLGIQTLEEM